jgi:hypothetical protein
MDTLTTGTNIDNLSHTTTTFTVSNGLLIWTSAIIISLLIIVFVLTWLLLRREKALQLMAFSISAVGLKLTYELNKDEKLKLLAQDNIALQNEIKILRTALDKEKFNSLRLFLVFIFTLLLFYVFDKLKFTKTKDKQTDIDKGDKSGI